MSRQQSLCISAITLWLTSAALPALAQFGFDGGMSGGMSGYAGTSKMNIQVPGPDGKPTEIASSKHWRYDYEIGSFRPNRVAEPVPGGVGLGGMMPGGMAGMGATEGGMGMGGDMMAGGMEDEMGGMSMMGGAGGYGGGGGGYGGGGGSEGMMGGMSGGAGMDGYGNSAANKVVVIHAYSFEFGETRDRIELYVFNQHRSVNGVMGAGGEAMESGEGEMRPNGNTLISLAQAVESKKWNAMESSEAEIVSTLIRQAIWKDEMIADLNRSKQKPAEFAKLEVELKELLAEAYDTQLQRREKEIANIEDRVAELRGELLRRQSAKTRVVEVQLGNIVLETQGLLGK